MSEQTKQDQKTDGLTPLAKRKRFLIACYESQEGNEITPAARSMIARAVSIEITLELMEAEQVAGKPINAERHARLARALARLLGQLGLTTSPGKPAKAPFHIDFRSNAQLIAQRRATAEGWSDAERDRWAEQQYERDIADARAAV
jgi:hypothetical protein